MPSYHHREKILNTVIDPVKDLLIKLYGSEKNFIETVNINPLEELLLTYDKFTGNENVVRKILLGINVEVSDITHSYVTVSIKTVVDALVVLTNGASG